MIYRGPGFFRHRMIGYSPPSPLQSANCLSRPATHRKTEKERLLAHGRGRKGVGEEPNQTTARIQSIYQKIFFCSQNFVTCAASNSKIFFNWCIFSFSHLTSGFLSIVPPVLQNKVFAFVRDFSSLLINSRRGRGNFHQIVW